MLNVVGFLHAIIHTIYWCTFIHVHSYVIWVSIIVTQNTVRPPYNVVYSNTKLCTTWQIQIQIHDSDKCRVEIKLSTHRRAMGCVLWAYFWKMVVLWKHLIIWCIDLIMFQHRSCRTSFGADNAVFNQNISVMSWDCHGVSNHWLLNCSVACLS